MAQFEWKMQTWTDLGDLGVTVCTRTTEDAYCMDYRVYEVAGIDAGGVFLYSQKEKDPSGFGMTESVELSMPIMHGVIRFDGCSHNYFGEGGYIHGCTQDSITRMADIFRRLWSIALMEVKSMKEFAR